MAIISPSVLASDFSRLGDEARRVEQAGAEYLHLDVMDGCFVPNISFGAPVIHSLRRCSGLVFDVHLMIEHPLDYIEDFAKAGADIITFHLEASSPIDETIDKILACSCKPAISLKPATPAKAVFPYLDRLSMVLVMTVEPGFGGQSFMYETVGKIREIREEIIRRGLKTDLEVDGGIGSETIGIASAAGANVFVAGSAVFGKSDCCRAITVLREEAQAHPFSI